MPPVDFGSIGGIVCQTPAVPEILLASRTFPAKLPHKQMTSPSPRLVRQAFSTWVFAFFLLMLGTAPLCAQSSKRHPKSTPTPSPSPSAKPGTSPAAANYELPDPVAIVDGEPIKRDDLRRVAAALLSANGRNVEELNASDKKRMYQGVLDEMITDRLITKASIGETVSDVDVEKRFSQMAAQYPTPKAFEDALKQAAQTADQVKASIRAQLRQTNWINKSIADQIKVEPLEADKFYKESPPTKFDEPEMVEASHILVAVRKDAPPEAVITAEEKLKVLTDRLAKKESFESLAKEFSDDPTAKQTSGELGYFSRDRIMPEFADAAFKLKIGEISQPVRTQFGFHLIKLTNRKPAHTATLEDAREQIMSYLQSEKRKNAIAKLVDSLKASATVENKI